MDDKKLLFATVECTYGWNKEPPTSSTFHKKLLINGKAVEVGGEKVSNELDSQYEGSKWRDIPA